MTVTEDRVEASIRIRNSYPVEKLNGVILTLNGGPAVYLEGSHVVAAAGEQTRLQPVAPTEFEQPTSIRKVGRDQIELVRPDLVKELGCRVRRGHR